MCNYYSFTYCTFFLWFRHMLLRMQAELRAINVQENQQVINQTEPTDIKQRITEGWGSMIYVLLLCFKRIGYQNKMAHYNFTIIIYLYTEYYYYCCVDILLTKLTVLCRSRIILLFLKYYYSSLYLVDYIASFLHVLCRSHIILWFSICLLAQHKRHQNLFSWSVSSSLSQLSGKTGLHLTPSTSASHKDFKTWPSAG